MVMDREVSFCCSPCTMGPLLLLLLMSGSANFILNNVFIFVPLAVPVFISAVFNATLIKWYDGWTYYILQNCF